MDYSQGWNRAFRCLINVTEINSVSGRRALDDQRIIGPVRLEGPPPLVVGLVGRNSISHAGTVENIRSRGVGIAQSPETLRKSEIWGL